MTPFHAFADRRDDLAAYVVDAAGNEFSGINADAVGEQGRNDECDLPNLVDAPVGHPEDRVETFGKSRGNCQRIPCAFCRSTV